MNNRIDLKELERQAFRTNFQDGLWDIYLGIFLLMVGASPMLSQSKLAPGWLLVIIAIFAAAAVLAFLGAKKFIVTPRLGVVKYGPARQQKRKKVTLIMSLSVLLGLVMLFATRSAIGLAQSWELPGWAIIAAIFGVQTVLIFSLGAYYMDYSRAYLYGWLYALALPITFYLMDAGIFIPIGALVFAAGMILFGLILFIRFLRQTPLPEVEG
ncbi:MAG: hypothetical protein H6667_23630 [Ardenticatenaceae bacterium]|nr:hypothetical protein [Ardenticatenaceae bacterium]MCB9445857.1 hypothetical protein [Ardenticatenaceae bacterium]